MNKYIKDLTFTTRMQNDFFEVSQDTPEVVCITDPMITPSSSDEDDLINRLPFTLAVELIDNNDARVHLTIDLTDVMDIESDRIKDLLKESYDDGYNVGQEAGSDDSYSSGYDSGSDEGYSDGHIEGYNEAEEEYQEKMAEMKSEYEDTIAELKEEYEELRHTYQLMCAERGSLLLQIDNLQQALNDK